MHLVHHDAVGLEGSAEHVLHFRPVFGAHVVVADNEPRGLVLGDESVADCKRASVRCVVHAIGKWTYCS